MKYLRKILMASLCLCLAMNMFGCGSDKKTVSSGNESSSVESQISSEVSSQEESPESQEESSQAQSEQPQSTPSKAASTVSSKKASTPSSTVSSKPAVDDRKNLCVGWLTGVNTSDKSKMYDWDKANKYIEASKSLECSWGSGYGKAWLVDGKKMSINSGNLFNMGAWISCTIKPGWGAETGDIYEDSVTWKKDQLKEWLIFDLQKSCSVSKVIFSTLYKGSDHGMPSDFTIQVSSNKENWTTVHTEKGYLQDITNVDQIFEFTAVNARYVKLNFTRGSSKPIDDNLAYCAALSEVEIWGK